MKREQTSGSRIYVKVSVEQLEADLWMATARYRGVAYAAKGASAESAELALLFVLEGERRQPPKP